MSSYLLNLVPAVLTPSGPILFPPGELVSDPSLITSIQAAGGIFAPSTDPLVSAAAAIATKLRLKGQNHELTAQLMIAASAQSANALHLLNSTLSIGASGTVEFAPGMVDRTGTVLAGYLEVVGPAAVGESATLQFRKNGVNVGSTLVYGNSSVPKTQIPLPAGVVGLAVVPGDVLDYTIVYVAGGGPTLTGENANHVVALTVN
jgi:hypothetical protein